MPRKMIDCRDQANDEKCTLAISGEEEEVVKAAAEHMVSVHGAEDAPDLRAQIRSALKDEPMTAGASYGQAGMRPKAESRPDVEAGFGG